MHRLVRTAMTTIALTVPMATIADDRAELRDTDLGPTVQELREKVRQSQRDVARLREPLRRESASCFANVKLGDKTSGRQISDVPDGCYYFYAKSVAPCQRMMPMIDRLNRQGFRIVKVDIAGKTALASHYQVKAVPTILIKRGPEVAKLTGMQDEQSLRSTLRQHQINDEAPGIAKKNRAEELVLVYPVGDLLRSSEPGNGPARKPDFDPILHLIVSLIEPESWEENGGPCLIKPVDKTLSLVVRQTPRVHAQIRIVLTELRNLKIEAPEEEP
jgi:thiol-disulfide isomerase/thioredoxin